MAVELDISGPAPKTSSKAQRQGASVRNDLVPYGVALSD